MVGSVIRASWHAFINGSLCAKEAAALPTIRWANCSGVSSSPRGAK
ncbi:Uncharacterised protein [Mycobacteroides abscessus subsp. abscessus]|nr:Uncharacterised protein [Mycobacteroides abscessus subsp. abscessus]